METWSQQAGLGAVIDLVNAVHEINKDMGQELVAYLDRAFSVTTVSTAAVSRTQALTRNLLGKWHLLSYNNY